MNFSSTTRSSDPRRRGRDHQKRSRMRGDPVNAHTSNPRGPKYPLQLRSRVSSEQLEAIKEAAEVAGMSLSKYVRARATGQTVVSKLDAKILRELNRLGGLLKHLFAHGQPVGPALTELRQAIATLKKEGTV